MGRDPVARERLSLRPFLVASLVLHLVAALLPVGRMGSEPEAPPAAPGSGADAGELGRELAALGMNPISVVELLVSGNGGAPAVAPSLAEEVAEEPAEEALVTEEALVSEAPPETVPEADEPKEVFPEADELAAGQEVESGGSEAAEGGAKASAGYGEPGPAGEGGGEVRLLPPVVIAMSWPEYPEGARKLSAIPIVLEVHVTVGGAVDSVRVESRGDCPPCEEAAIASAWRMRFRPATLGGIPVPAWARVPMTFRRR